MPEMLILPITQATAATFTDLYIGETLLVFVRKGTKRVLCPDNGELIGRAGDLMIFPPGSIITLENRPVLDDNYRADGVCFAHGLVETVFPDRQPYSDPPGIQLLRAGSGQPSQILALLKDTLGNADLPPAIRQHRLLEPLIWLRHHGVRLAPRDDGQPLNRVRALIETDLSHPWRASEVAGHFAMSEATLRRWLAKSGYGFAQILLNSRLEKGLTLLQATDIPISRIALDCGFKTPSHFSDSFRKRFGIPPRSIRLRGN